MSYTAVKRGALTEGQYMYAHAWARKILGKPNRCGKCGTITAKRFEWANLSGQYKREPKDWVRLCKSCHANFDKGSNDGDNCKRGHPRTPENQYITPSSGFVNCLPCKKLLLTSWRKTNA